MSLGVGTRRVFLLSPPKVPYHPTATPCAPSPPEAPLPNDQRPAFPDHLHEEGQTVLKKKDLKKALAVEMTDYNVVVDEAGLRRFVDHYRDKPAFSFDVETIGEHRGEPVRNVVTWISFATDDDVTVIPIQHPNGELSHVEYPLLASGVRKQAKGLALLPSDYSRDKKKAIYHFTAPPKQLRHAEVFTVIEEILRGPALKIGHNLKFDLKSVTKYMSGPPAPRFFCTMIASWLIDPARTGRLGLDDCLRREFDYEMVKGIGADISQHSFDDVAKYSALDSYWTYRLAVALLQQIKQPLMLLEMDVLEALVSMELEGAPIDTEALSDLHTLLEKEIDEAVADVYRIAGKAFNLNSNKEKQEILFGKKSEGGRGLRAYKKTATGAPSTSAEALETYRGKDALVDAMLHHADLNKLMGTYVIPYHGGTVTRTTGGKSKEVEKKSLMINGRIHTEFVQNGAETGRFSSRNPNLQNVPNARTEHGMAIRKLFRAPEGYVLVCADYSQIEPRVIAALTKDPTLMGAYKEGRDVYTAMVEGKELAPYGLNRDGGKLAVLAMSYGVGPDKVESGLHIPKGRGKVLLKAFEKQFASVYRYKRKVVATASNRKPVPYVETMFGRRRYLPELLSKEFWRRGRAERQAFNTEIQGTAADVMKIAIVRAHRMLPPEAKLILTIHDELLTLCPEHMADEVAEIIREAMEGIQIFEDIDLVADVQVAKTWGEAK